MTIPILFYECELVKRKMSENLISAINALTCDQIQEVFKNVVELWPEAATVVSARHPFNSSAELISCFYQYLDSITVDTKVSILRSHPDLAGKLLDENKLSSESANEQTSAGLDQLTSDQKQELKNLNKEYKKKFDFPFVICVRQSNKFEVILQALNQRLNNPRDVEIDNAINEVKKISEIRVLDILQKFSKEQ